MAGHLDQHEDPHRAERRAWVMGTDAHVIVHGDDAARLADIAIARLQRLEARWSRFLPDSEISRLNDRTGVPVLVASETFALIDHALAGWRMTEGRFDPTMLAVVRAAGYDRSFELLGRPETGAPETEPGADRRAQRTPRVSAPRPTAPDIRLDRVVGTVQLGSSTAFDPGGIGKGFAADLVVEELVAMGARGVLVNVGGDLRAAGESPSEGAWVVAIADPLDVEHGLGNLCLEAGAVASSWRTKRVWIGPDGMAHHHLIDPRTGRSASTGVAGVTVVAACGWQAEVLAKAAFVAGPEEGPTLIARSGAAGIVVADDGSVHPAGDIDAFLPRVSANAGA